MAPAKGVLAHREANGVLHAYIALNKPERWLGDLAVYGTVRERVLAEFEDWALGLTSLITNSETPPILRPIHALPIEHRWERTAGVTLLGDAAHLMSPFAGEGANLAMFDGAELGNTLLLVLVNAFFSIVIGATSAAILTLSTGTGVAVIRGYVALFRNTPLIVQMYFFYFAIGSIMPVGRNEIGLPKPLIGSFSWAIISLSLYSGAFNVETFRAGVGAVHTSYEEAALAFG